MRGSIPSVFAAGSRLLASLVAALALVASGSASASLAQDPSPTPAEASPEIHGWPGARRNPDGLYSWTVGPAAWMHNVTSDGTPVEIIFSKVDETWRIPVDDLASASADLDGPYLGRPQHVADTRIQAWLLDTEGTRVVVIVKSFADSDPALVAESEAIVESVYVEPTETATGHRLVFTLRDGWDSG